MLLAGYDVQINQRILEVRKTLGYSQQVFSAGIELSRSYQAGIEIKKHPVNDRLIKMICMTYGVNEAWLRTGEGDMFSTENDPRLGRIIRNFNKMDELLQDYVVKYLDWLVDYYGGCRKK